MKQFSRCANCRKWYLDRAVTTVDILQGNGMRRTALWCQVCIREAEQRSQYAAEATDDPDLQPADATDTFGALLQEHFDLMEEALLEENDDAIASRISDFMARGRTHLEELNEPEQAQRLTTHLHYWQTFLRALNP